MMARSVRGMCVCILVSTTALGDVILDWNDVMTETIRATGGPPCPISRAYAMMHVAMFDAVNSIEGTHMPYHMDVTAPAGASAEAAAAAAAHRICNHLFPERAEIYDAALAESLAAIPDGPAELDGIDVGVRAAEGLIMMRSGDGSDSEETYEFSGAPGDYVTPEDVELPPFNPSWGRCRPWCMNRGMQFRPPPPPVLASGAYAEAFNEVKSLGARDSETRTEEQTEIAWFWANDRDGTYKPPGQLNAITQTVARRLGNTMAENARLFALVNLALAEAGIVAWDAKYDTGRDLWRPITGIRRANEDGNDATAPDAEWLPLNDFTPPFPAYVSGHATFAAAHAAVMARYYGTDEIEFTVGTDEPAVRDMTRTYASFSEAALENGRSRVYLGVHWDFDSEEGFKSGTALGNYVADSFLQPRQGFDEPPPLCGAGLFPLLPLAVLGMGGHACWRASRRRD